MISTEQKLRNNTQRQQRYRERQREAGRVLLKVWIGDDSKQNLLALAGKRRRTLDQAVEMAINDAWYVAGRP